MMEDDDRIARHVEENIIVGEGGHDAFVEQQTEQSHAAAMEALRNVGSRPWIVVVCQRDGALLLATGGGGDLSDGIGFYLTTIKALNAVVKNLSGGRVDT